MKPGFFQRHIKSLFGALAILYPLLVFCALVIFKLGVKFISVFLVIFAFAYIFINRKNFSLKKWGLVITPVILFGIGIICLLTESKIILKIYPALADLAYLTFFGVSLFIPPPVAFYFVDIFDKKVKTIIPTERFNQFCKNATISYCIYFFIDGVISAYIVFLPSDTVWGIYNGFVTYALMGLVFIVEFIILKALLKKYKQINAPEASNDYS